MKDTINNIVKLQTQVFALKMWLLVNKQIAYTQDQIGLMEEVLRKEDKMNELNTEAINLTIDVGIDVLKPIMTNKELMQTEYLFTKEMQREAVKEVLGFDMDIEELQDWVEKNRM